ncbi:MAG TPA: transglycosylase SLT domain-containing protein [Pyrinomonadaceae bacterium]|jgi:soluble lytic murein transglycosylase-like protein
MLIKVRYLFLLLFASATMIYAQSPDGTQQSIRAAVEQRNWPTVVAETARIRSSDPNLFRAGNYDYLHGRAAEKTGDLATSGSSYQAVVSRNGRLAEYALWHLSRLARGTGDLTQEREYLRRLIASSPNSLLHDAAVLRLAESFFESGDFAAAATSARAGTSSKNVSLARENQLLLGQALLREAKTPEAHDVFLKLLMQMPDASRPDDFALQATRELDQMEKVSGQAQPTEADRLLRASVYQFNRDFAGARAHYEEIIKQNPQSPTVPNAMYQLGRGMYQEGKYSDAITYFQRVSDQFPQSSSTRDALGYLASSYTRMKRTDDGINVYKTLIERFTDGPGLERPYLNVIDALHEAARYPEALNWVQQTRNRFKGDIGATLALFAQLRIHLAQNGWKDAIKDAEELLKLTDLGGTRVPGGTTTAEVNFLRAYALEQSGRVDEAVTGYLALPDGRNDYYGTRATQRLTSLASNDRTRSVIESRRRDLLSSARTAAAGGQLEQARQAAQTAIRLSADLAARNDALVILRNAYAALPSYQLHNFAVVSLVTAGIAGDISSHQMLANDLLLLGLYDEALPELLAVRAERATTPSAQSGSDKTQTIKETATFSDEDYSVAVYSLQGGLPNRAVRFAEQFWRTVPADYVLELAPRTLVELLYPIPYRESLLRHAPSRNVDLRFVLSIARQESRFQADAKSAAAARGMMQFIVSTANEVATQLKLNNFSQDNLYDPDTAILFGSQYLGHLFQQFPNQPEAVAAAYNGGADNMGRWMSRSRSTEPERYVPEIGFSQSKDYVYRVMSNFWTYQQLYDTQLQPIGLR